MSREDWADMALAFFVTVTIVYPVGLLLVYTAY